MLTTAHTDPHAIKAHVRDFVGASIRGANIADDTDLFGSGIANSLFAVQLMTFIEKTFAIEVGMDDLDIANFKSIDAASAFVQRKRARAA